MSESITLVGSANIDFIIKMPRLPVKGETVSGGEFVQAFGGKGSNQAIAAQRAGGMVNAVISLGGDSFGRELLSAYKAEGMNTDNVALRNGVASGTAIIQVDAEGNNTIALAEGANGLLSVEQVEAAREAIASSALVMLQMEVPDAAIERAIEIASENGTEVMLNFAPCRETLLRLSDKVGILVVNETEAAALSGLSVESDAEAAAAARILAERGHRLVVVTLGANGSLVRENGESKHYPAFRVKAVDATAAGDSFCGALAVGLAAGRPLVEAMRYASAAGAICASRFGAMPSIPTRAEIEEFLSQKKS